MERKGNIKRRWRIVFGALIGAAIPFGLAIYENGTPLAWDMNTWVVIGGLSAFLSALCAAAASGISDDQKEGLWKEEHVGINWQDYHRDKSDMDMMIGDYEYMREAYKSGYRAFD